MIRKEKFIFIFSACLFLYLFLIYDSNFHGADEPVYYSYTASVVEDGDLNIIDQASPNFDTFLVTKTYNLPDSHNHGGVILWVPFYLYGKLVYILSNKFNITKVVHIGLDKIAKCVLSLSTVLFGLLMLLLTYSFSKSYFPKKYIVVSIVALFIGTPFFYYMLFESGNANVIASLFSILSIWFCWYLVSNSSPAYWFLYGIFFSLCVSVKTELWFQILFIFPLFICLFALKRIRLTNLLYFLIGLIPITVLRAINAYLKYGTVHMEEVIYLDSMARYMPTYCFNGLFSSFRGIFYTSPVFYICILGLVFILWNTVKGGRCKKEIDSVMVQNIFLVLLGCYAITKLLLIGKIFSPAAQELSMRVLISEFPVFVILFTAGLSFSTKMLSRVIMTLLPLTIFWNFMIVSEHIAGLEWLYVSSKPDLVHRIDSVKYLLDYLIVPRDVGVKFMAFILLFLISILVYGLTRKFIKSYRIQPSAILSVFTIYGVCAYFAITILNCLNNKNNVEELKESGFFQSAEVISTPVFRMDKVEEEQHLRNLFQMMRYYVLKGDIGKYRYLKTWRKRIFDDKECVYSTFYQLDKPYKDLAQFYTTQNRYKKAIQCYKDLLNINPLDTDALIGLGDIYYNLSDYNSAIEVYKRAIEIRSDFINGYRRLIEVYAKLGEWENALKYCHKYLTLNPGDINMLKTLGELYCQKGEYTRAIDLFKKVISLAPYFKDAYFNLAEIYKNMGYYDKALEIYKRSIRINGVQDVDAYMEIASIYRERNKNDKAIEYYEEALKLRPERADIYQAIGDVYKEEGRYREAEEYYKEALKRNDKLVDIYMSLGDINWLSGREDKAISYYQKVIELRPNKIDAYMNIGHIYKSRGDNKDALIYFRKVIQIKPDYAEAYYHLGDAFNNLADKEKASKQVNKLRKLGRSKLADELEKIINENGSQ